MTAFIRLTPVMLVFWTTLIAIAGWKAALALVLACVAAIAAGVLMVGAARWVADRRGIVSLGGR